LKNTPRFFCDYCNYEVDNKAKTCPHCGRLFTSVRCPACGHSGPDSIFRNGCPKCGYSADLPEKVPITPKIKQPRLKPRFVDTPPVWAYIISFFVMIIAFLILFYFINK